jgi:hypothetical protein
MSSDKKHPLKKPELPAHGQAERESAETREAGQSGDTEGISDVASVDSESVRELAEEGQDFEAMVVDGVENAPEPDQGEVKTHEVPEDDVPPEYRNYRENG